MIKLLSLIENGKKSRIIEIKNRLIQRKRVKFDSKMHKQNEWIILLNQLITKDSMCKSKQNMLSPIIKFNLKKTWRMINKSNGISNQIL